MKKLNSLRVRIILAFTLLSFICAIAYGFTSDFISQVVNDQVFNWYVIEDARVTAKAETLPENGRLRVYIEGSNKDLYQYLVDEYGLSEPFSKDFLGMQALANKDRVSEAELVYEFEIGEMILQIVSTPRKEYRQFVIYNITEFSSSLNDRAFFSDKNTKWLVVPLTIFVTAIGLVFGLMLSRRVMRPLTRLAKIVQGAKPENIPSDLSANFYFDEVGVVAKTIEQLMEKIEKYVQHERRFSREVSHELRTPVTSISIALDLIEETKLNEKQRNILDRINRANRDMTHLIQTFLLIGRDQIEYVKETDVDVKRCIDDIVDKHKHVLRSKPVTIDVEVKEKFIFRVCEYLFETVISNLVRNAFQYTAEGSVRIVAHQDKIEIIDTGHGIPAQELDRISQPYHKLQPEGIGLGLSIVQRIVEKMKWQFLIDSEEDVGTIVTLKIS